MSLSDALLFIREWFRNPRSVAAIFPSGTALASLITKEISANTGPVVELGPGTGAFTQALLKRGVRQQDLTLIEYSSDFARLLQTRFPQARVLWMDAAGLDRNGLFDGAPVGAVVCGLGFLNMPEDKIRAILKGAFGYVRPGGSFFLFTYGARCSVPDATLAALDLQAIWVGRTFQNIPPASVYRIERRSGNGG
ncbi:class I SAM-dependent methyltransferase [Pleomorphomonas sp. PLEO]|uniref:class I SAM-dependent methyltransferase n=1 Tax=Pleomorphomonas sp. PLEO TaxID=3239306 RepID=UPI00351F32CD